MEILFVIALILAIIFWFKKSAAEKEIVKREQLNRTLVKQLEELEQRLAQLAKYQGIIDAEARAQDILSEANDTLNQAKAQADRERKDANQAARAKIDLSDEKLRVAGEEVNRIITAAKQRAEEIAGDAYTAMNRAKEFSETAQAMKNIIEGYGDAYIVPSYSLLDDLADEFGHAEAGQKLKEARDSSRAMVKAEIAATCEYAETNRKETAIRFVVDAFNGKVDSILSRGKADNHGKLEQEIRDAFAVVNHNGSAFRNAKITDQYLAARLSELKWAATAHALKDEEREEQRRLREEMREEEKARREFERAIKDAAKEEESIKKAMERVQQQVAAANDAQRVEFEAKLQELQMKLQAAEEKNQRALSMAQQTRTGHVYVISNVGSFGENVFKIGMTRRLEPTDRVRELGDASVPFEFDIHAMIYSEDAPSLEKKLHRHFLRQQVNKVNPRKEFFRLGLSDIRREVESFGETTHWTMAAEALHYRESLRIEQRIIENPAIEHEWTKHQMEFEPIQEEEEEVA
jgi:seryl-tRNA synthetase